MLTVKKESVNAFAHGVHSTHMQAYLHKAQIASYVQIIP